MANQLGSWREVVIDRHLCHVYEPPAANAQGYVAIYLHNRRADRLEDKLAFVDAFNRHGLRVICPQAGPTWWTDRLIEEFDPQISAEQFVCRRLVDWIGECWQMKPPSIALLGVSMGGQGALRMAFRHPRVFPVVAAISPAIDYQPLVNEGDEVLYRTYGDPESARQDTATLHVHPLNWPPHIWFGCDPADRHWFEGADRLRMKLAALGIAFECDLETSAPGHSHDFEYFSRMAPRAIEFVAARLDAERRRVS